MPAKPVPVRPAVSYRRSSCACPMTASTTRSGVASESPEETSVSQIAANKLDRSGSRAPLAGARVLVGLTTATTSATDGAAGDRSETAPTGEFSSARRIGAWGRAVFAHNGLSRAVICQRGDAVMLTSLVMMPSAGPKGGRPERGMTLHSDHLGHQRPEASRFAALLVVAGRLAGSLAV